MVVLKRILLLICSLIITAQVSSAEVTLSLTVNGIDPLTGTIPEGADYASVELKNPWDFSERRDIGWEEGYDGRSVQVQNGVWKGVQNTEYDSSAYLFPLFAGFANNIHAEGVDGDRTLPRFGAKHFINPSKYRYLSFAGLHTDRKQFVVYWKTDPTNNNTDGFVENDGAFWPDGSQFCAQPDLYSYRDNSPKVVNMVDLSNCSGSGSWAGNVIALRLDPSMSASKGSRTELDWMRLVDPSSAPGLQFNFNSEDHPTAYYLEVFVDNNNSGFDGIPFAQFPVTGNGTIPSAALPPGRWYFYAKTMNPSRVVLATSSYTREVRINQAPSINFTSPTELTGKDMASSELNNPWDMTDSSDVYNKDGAPLPYSSQNWRQWSDPQFTGGVFSALSDRPLPGNLETDSMVMFPFPKGGVDSAAYRYFVFRLGLDSTQYPSLHDRVVDGFVARLVAWNDLTGFDKRFAPMANILYEGMHTYVIDLHNPDIHEFRHVPNGTPWLDNETWSNFRLDTQETRLPTRFFLDYAMLVGENHGEEGKFNIGFNIADSDSNSFDVSLYYDSDDKGFNGKLITTLNGLAKGHHDYTWKMSGIASGSRVWVYAVVSDGVNLRKYYAPVEIIAGDTTSDRQLLLRSPLYTLWNSFLGMTNVLELVNKSVNSNSVKATFYSVQGLKWHEMTIPLVGRSQRDIILNDLPGWVNNSYGVVRLQFTGSDVDGRMSFYRRNLAQRREVGDDFEFAFSDPLQNPLKGTSYASYNTYQPSLNPADSKSPVFNWLSVVNLNTTLAKKFIIKRYDITGRLLATSRIQLAPLGRADIDGGHGSGANQVGYNEIIPEDITSPYKAMLVRYGMKADGSYSFAFLLRAVPAGGTEQWVQASRTEGGQNWLELVNVKSSEQSVQLYLYDQDGIVRTNQKFNLAARSQRHIELSSLLAGNELGSARVVSRESGAVIAQSMYYFRGANGSISSMYALQADAVKEGSLNSSWNLFLGMNNWLRLFNTNNTNAYVRVVIYNGATEKEKIYSILPRRGLNLGLQDFERFGTVANNYGVIRVVANKVIGDLVRAKPTNAGNLDFVTPVSARQ